MLVSIATPNNLALSMLLYCKVKNQSPLKFLFLLKSHFATAKNNLLDMKLENTFLDNIKRIHSHQNKHNPLNIKHWNDGGKKPTIIHEKNSIIKCIFDLNTFYYYAPNTPKSLSNTTGEIKMLWTHNRCKLQRVKVNSCCHS